MSKYLHITLLFAGKPKGLSGVRLLLYCCISHIVMVEMMCLYTCTCIHKCTCVYTNVHVYHQYLSQSSVYTQRLFTHTIDFQSMQMAAEGTQVCPAVSSSFTFTWVKANKTKYYSQEVSSLESGWCSFVNVSTENYQCYVSGSLNCFRRDCWVSLALYIPGRQKHGPMCLHSLYAQDILTKLWFLVKMSNIISTLLLKHLMLMTTNESIISHSWHYFRACLASAWVSEQLQKKSTQHTRSLGNTFNNKCSLSLTVLLT